VLASMAVIAVATLVSVSFSQMKHPGITEYAGPVTTSIALRDDSGAVRAHLTLHRQGGASTYEVTDVSGNVYSSSGAASSRRASGSPLPSSSLGSRKSDASDDVKALRRDLDSLNNTVNAVIARVNELSTGQ